jgi:hypothetical protein
MEMGVFSNVFFCGSLLVRGHWEGKSNIPWNGIFAE